MHLRSLAMRSLATILALGALDQGCRLTLLTDNRFLGRPVAPFDPPLFSPSQWAKYERIVSGDLSGTQKFDPELGWCNKPDSGFGEFRYDWAGCRISERPLARDKPSGVRRVLAIGCSMTHGEEVAASETWCAQVDREITTIEIANLGVAAYGIDQALMRLIRDGPALDGDEVWLGFLPSAALRVTTLYRPLVDHWSLDIAFKPRFVLDNKLGLRRLPCPVLRIEDISRLLSDQRAFLDAMMGEDFWIQRAPQAYAPRGSQWAHFSFVGRMLLTVFEASGRVPLESLENSRNENYSLLAAIVLECAEEARRQACTFRLLILPGKKDLDSWEAHGCAPWQGWLDSLQHKGISIVDVSEALILEGGKPIFAPQGHYSSEGSRVVANAIVKQLRSENSNQ